METKEILELISKYSLKAKIEQAKTGKASILDKIRKEVFVPKQKISVIRKWFMRLWEIELTDEELNIVKSIIVKPKSSQWELILKIIVNQKHLTEAQVIEWFSYVKKHDRAYLSFELIKDNRLQNDDFKIDLFKELLLNRDYLPKVIQELDISLNLGNLSVWEKYFDVLIDIINKDNELSKKILFYWSKSIQLDAFAKEKNIASTTLYTFTKKEQYLPQAAIDTFIF